jgi:ADP-heptose:LPS heptosyltransferase
MPTSPQTAPPLPQDVRRILVIRPRFVGDVCLTLPVVSNLARLAPQAEIHYLVEPEAAPLLADDPRLARVWIAPRKASALEQARLCAELHGARFDVVIDLFCNPRTALWTASTRARWRVGYPNKKLRSAVYNLHAHPKGLNAVRFHLASLEALGWPVVEEVPALAIAESERLAAWNHLSERGVPGGTPLVGFHPGARFPTRQWAAEDFAALGRQLLERHPRLWVLVFAGPGEEVLARTIAHDIASPRVLAITDVALRRFAALASLCSTFVAGDSGPMNIAVAAGTPTVGIFGRSEPERTMPYDPETTGHRAVYARVWCSPCVRDVCDHMSCMRAISPEWVGENVERALAFAALRPARAGGAAGPVPLAVLAARPTAGRP